EMETNQTLIDTLELSNIGSGLINYTLEIEQHNSWIELGSESGNLFTGETDEIEITFNTNNLSNGEYSCNIIITDDIRNETIIPVTLTVTGTEADPDLIPEFTELTGNYPNPFNPQTIISFGLNRSSKVTLDIYNIKGQKVRTLVNGNKQAGYHKIIWDGKDNFRNKVGSGIYFYKMTTDDYNNIRKMILLK
ncbi:MAG TPA: T9SS type A sorting domain-containing protein, partial [Candidatus Cloacimonetes bacterium]|nr:T9SS type A sorting domain-containing protein [Candidatus Cloacimonadota bacterium]